ncbi:protein rep [Ferrovibrio terrae]|uniref:protein rep n=1 Tax=Ferrovibrio terrae TaxID=2594003 RepID=UPI00313806F0
MSALINTQAEFRGRAQPLPKLPAQEWRYRLRRVAGKLLGSTERVFSCGYKHHKSIIDIRRTSHGSLHYAGLETCGSVWTCPVCAARVAEARRDEVEKIMDAHTSMGGAVYMATFTIRHHAFQRCGDLRASLVEAWRRVQQGSVWQGLKERYGIIGTIRALEVTHGQNGWHPHLHLLICTKRILSDVQQSALADGLWNRWSSSLHRGGLGSATRDAFQFDRCGTAADAGAYVAKWGAASELVKGHAKLARGGGMSPWQLLREAGAGSKEAANLFREYAKAFKGARQLTWSVGFRAAYGFGPEVDDDHLLEDTAFTTETICHLPSGIFRQVVVKEIEVAVLNAADAGIVDADGVVVHDPGWPAVLARIRDAGIAWPDGEGWFNRPIAVPESEAA